ncbi:MAG: S41 family peptidase [SAR324 cluster bacterium]|nr:S41 family peptidase [SAR324 cluster bacterium]
MLKRPEKMTGILEMILALKLPLRYLGRKFWCRTVFMGITLGLLTTGLSKADNLDDEIRLLEDFSETYHLIQSQYAEYRTPQQLIRFAIEGMVSRLDPYSEAFDREELEILESEVVGKYAGIGVSIQKDKGRHIVTQVIKGSPAEQAGLKPGDVIVQLEGLTLASQREIELSKLVRGEMGSPLSIGFYHPEKPDDIITRSIVRTLIQASSTLFFERDPSTAVIQIQQFQKSTSAEIEAILSEKEYAAVILDLRNNPGGLFLAAVETAELFISGGDIVEIRDRDNELIERYVSRKIKRQKPPVLIVMINRYSASSAEIVAGAIKDREVGLIVGEKSFGKGVVQTIFPLGKDLFIKLTTAHYLTPSGISFHQIGIKPDHPVVDTIDITRYGADDQIYKKSLELVDQLCKCNQPTR